MLKDHDLLRAYVARSSDAAFAQLMCRHFDEVHAAALRLAMDADLADDATQGAFILLARVPQKVHPNAPLSAWLLRVLRHIVQNELRMRRRRTRHERRAASAAGAVRRTSRAAIRWEDFEPSLTRVVSALAPSDSATIRLTFYEGKSVAKVARALRIFEGAARKRRDRAVRRLRRLAATSGCLRA